MDNENQEEPKKKKRKYEPPAIIHEEIVEAVASMCTSSWLGDGLTCRTGTGSCENGFN